MLSRQGRYRGTGDLVQTCGAPKNIEQTPTIGTDNTLGTGFAQAGDLVTDDGFRNVRVSDVYKRQGIGRPISVSADTRIHRAVVHARATTDAFQSFSQF